MKILFVNHDPGLFMRLDCCSGKEVAHAAVVNYCKWATTKLMQ